MQSTRIFSALAACGTIVALAATAPAALAKGKHGGHRDGHGKTLPRFLATDSAGNLHTLKDTRDGLAPVRTTKLTFFPAGATRLVGLDQRPFTGEFYGIGDNSVVYRVNPRTGVAIGVAGTGTAAFSTTLRGANFGVDFNPTSPGGGAIRIVSDANFNGRVSPDTGAAGAGTPDGDLNGLEGAKITHAAYTNSGLSTTQPTETKLYVLDAAKDRLATQNPPNAGTLVDAKRLRFDVTEVGGFDIDGSGTGYVASERRWGTELHTLDVATGKARSVSGIRGVTLTGLTVAQRP
jgi:hypothetical protein